MRKLTAVLAAALLCLAASATVAGAHYWPTDAAKLKAFTSVRDRCIARYHSFCRTDLIAVTGVATRGAHTLRVKVRWAHTVVGAGHITSTCSVDVTHTGGVRRHC